jgi:hypothetical protein
MKFQSKKGFEKPCFWSPNIIILQLVKFLIMNFFEKKFFNELTKRSYGWISKKNSKNNE